MTEPTVSTPQKQVPTFDFKRVVPTTWNYKIPDHYDLLFIRVVDTDSFFVLRNAHVFSLHIENALMVRGVDILDGSDYEVTNPTDVFYIPKPLYLDQ